MEIGKRRRAYPSPVLPDWWTSLPDIDPDHGKPPRNSISLDTETHGQGHVTCISVGLLNKYASNPNWLFFFF